MPSGYRNIRGLGFSHHMTSLHWPRVYGVRGLGFGACGVRLAHTRSHRSLWPKPLITQDLNRKIKASSNNTIETKPLTSQAKRFCSWLLQPSSWPLLDFHSVRCAFVWPAGWRLCSRSEVTKIAPKYYSIPYSRTLESGRLQAIRGTYQPS